MSSADARFDIACFAGSASETIPENAPLIPDFTWFITPTMFSAPMALMTFATPLVTEFFMFENEVAMPPTASWAWAEKLAMPSPPFWSRSTIASAKSETETLPSFMAW